MSRRNLIILLILGAAAAVILLLLRPCGQGPLQSTQSQPAILDLPANAVQKKTEPPVTTNSIKREGTAPAEKAIPVEKTTLPPAHEIDNAPPVNLSNSEQIPNVAKCAMANFPAEAKPHVKVAIVTVRLIVDKFGNVRGNTPLSVEFPQEVDEEVLPAMRKLFITAGARAFGSKKCPPHVVNGQNVGYAIEVPLQYKH